jgi:hypothetical protein
VSPYKTPVSPGVHLTLLQLSQAVQEHYGDHPGHSSECVCLDPLTTAIARSLLPREDDNEWRRAAVVSDRTRDGIAHVLAEIARKL